MIYSCIQVFRVNTRTHASKKPVQAKHHVCLHRDTPSTVIISHENKIDEIYLMKYSAMNQHAKYALFSSLTYTMSGWGCIPFMIVNYLYQS